MSQTDQNPTIVLDLNNQRKTPRSINDCTVFLAFITGFVFLIGSVPAITKALIFIQPQVPEFNLNPISLTILNVSNSNNTVTTKNWKITFSVNNPNKSPMNYDHITVSVIDNNKQGLDQVIDTTTVAPLKQNGQALKDKIRVAFGNVLLQCPDFACGVVSLRLELQAKAIYGGWTWPVKTDSIKVVCDNLKVQIPDNINRNHNMVIGSSNTITRCDVIGQWTKIVVNCRHIFWKYLYVVGIFSCIIALSL